ncbi:MAG: NmrA/HSCARG family protein [Ignavibacteria bacterium]|nr:NmrA/HSCARG family protein [Ignavibacteria bacterium]
MSQQKTIVVFGATGAQGGGLVRAILADPAGGFSVRAVTRDLTSDKSKALAAMGAEVVVADIDDAASVRKALEGAYGAFFVTFFWAHFSPDKESAEVKIFADAAKDAGIQHAIWSTLEDTRDWYALDDDRMPTLHGKYKVPHFDGKGQSNHYFTDAGVPTTFLLASFYWDNFIYFGLGPKRGEDGKLTLTMPMGDKQLSGIGAEDIGKCAYGIFKKGSALIGKSVGVAGENITLANMCALMSKALGEEVTYNAISPAVFRSFGFPGADDLGNMFQFYDEQSDYLLGVRNPILSKELNPSLQNFSQWLADNAKRIPL